MIQVRRISRSRWWNNRKTWIFLLIFSLMLVSRLSKSLIFRDIYYFISQPFWPGEYQHQILLKSADKALNIKIKQLEMDNLRLRKILNLKNTVEENKISAAVISRNIGSWWHKIVLNKGLRDGVKSGDAVVGPGGLIGIIKDSSKFTSSVQLLTAPASKVGVWSQRNNLHGLLTGVGTDTPQLFFYSKDADIKIGDYILSSPASTLLPPNIPIGIIQSINNESQPNAIAKIQLTANPAAIDWVQIFKNEF